MAWPLLTVSGCYCLGLSQLHVNVQLQPITRREIVHPSIHQCILSVDRIRARLPLLNAQTNGDYDSEQLIEDLRVPQQWLQPSKALEVTPARFSIRNFILPNPHLMLIFVIIYSTSFNKYTRSDEANT